MSKISISNKLSEAHNLIGECVKLFNELEIMTRVTKEDFYEIQDAISFLEEEVGEDDE